MLLLTAVLPRRADTTAVIGTAMRTSARGIGYRRIATQPGRPACTVRRWVPALREDHHLDWLREQGIEWITRLAPHIPPWTLIGQFTHGRLVTPTSTG